MLTLSTFEEAAKKVKEVTQETKLIYSPNFSKETGNEVYLKPENMQRTGAYKVRGANYKISTLTDDERQRGLITASAGNHAQGVAYAASKYALEAWSDALRMELRHSGIKVSLIEPGPIRTRFTENVNQTQSDKPVENPGIAARFTLGPEAVVAKVRHAFESDRPKLRYPVTLVTHAVGWLKRLLPGRMMDKILHG